MTTLESHETIYDASVACRKQFSDCLTNDVLMINEWPRKRLADFNLWAAGCGALAKEKASLDERLSSKQTIKVVILNLLSLLITLVKKCHQEGNTPASEDVTKPVDGQDEDEDEDEDDSPKSLAENCADVEEVLAQLVRISIAIRRSGNQARLDRADDSFDPTRHDELRAFLSFLLKVPAFSDDLQISAEQMINAIEITPIQQRLIEANVKRRHRFLYAQRRWRKQEQEREALPSTLLKPNVNAQTFAIEDMQEQNTKQAKADPTTTKTNDDVKSPPTITSTVPTFVPGRIDLPARTQPSMIAASSTGSKIKYPKPPTVQEGQHVFRCPCCCQTLPVAFAKGARWKRHISEDVLPYTCILDACPRPYLLYHSRKEWTTHLRDDHIMSQYWLCFACSEVAKFDEESDFIAHLELEHHKDISADQIPYLLSACLCTTPLTLSSCPLCPITTSDGTDPEAVLSHVAEHIHSFALYSLPWQIPGEREKEYLGRESREIDEQDYFAVSSGAATQDHSGSVSSDGRRRAFKDEGLPDLDFQDDGPQEPTETEDTIPKDIEVDQLSQLSHNPSPWGPFPSTPFPEINDDRIPAADHIKARSLNDAKSKVLDSGNIGDRIAWARDVIRCADIEFESAQRESSAEPNLVSSVDMHNLQTDAIEIIDYYSEQSHPDALYTQSKIFEFGQFGYTVDQKKAFDGYKRAAEGGNRRSEYRMGMFYEQSNEPLRAKDHYRKGMAHGDAAASYRMGMLSLLGQYGEAKNSVLGLERVRQAADSSDYDAPQGAYVYGMLLCRDLPNIDISEDLLPLDLTLAKKYLEKAALQGFAKAQLRMGQAYELSNLDCEFNPAYSIHYYWLASRQGLPEAALGVSRWLLLGYEDAFAKNEQYAFYYAEQAAAAKFATAEFALGYYYETGVYVGTDIATAVKWYQLAAKQGNQDAIKRLASLKRGGSIPIPQNQDQEITAITNSMESIYESQPDIFEQDAYGVARALLPLDIINTQNTEQVSTEKNEIKIKPSQTGSAGVRWSNTIDRVGNWLGDKLNITNHSDVERAIIKAVGRQEFINFQNTWKSIDRNGGSYMNNHSIPLLFSRLTGVFRMHIYDKEDSVSQILKDVKSVSKSRLYYEDLPCLNQRINSINIYETRHRRNVLRGASHAVAVLCNPEGFISSDDVLMVLSYMLALPVSNSFSAWTKRDDLLIKDRIRDEIVSGAVETIYWARRFKAHQKRWREAWQTMEVLNADKERNKLVPNVYR